MKRLATLFLLSFLLAASARATEFGIEYDSAIFVKNKVFEKAIGRRVIGAARSIDYIRVYLRSDVDFFRLRKSSYFIFVRGYLCDREELNTKVVSRAFFKDDFNISLYAVTIDEKIREERISYTRFLYNIFVPVKNDRDLQIIEDERKNSYQKFAYKHDFRVEPLDVCIYLNIYNYDINRRFRSNIVKIDKDTIRKVLERSN